MLLPEGSPAQALERQREAAYEEVRTLNQDYLLGDVPQEQYEARLQVYRLRAARLLQQLDDLQELDRQWEARIATFRAGDGATTTAVICQECGGAVSSRDVQCPHCGSAIAPADPTDRGGPAGKEGNA